MKTIDIDSVLSEALKTDEQPSSILLQRTKVTVRNGAPADNKPSRRHFSKMVVIAAALCLVIGISVTALATNFFGLQSLTLPGNNENDTVDTPVGAVTRNPMQLITLQGFPGTPEYAAAVEWQEYYNTLDIWMILQVHGDTVMPEEYWYYAAYSPEMVYKVFEIAEKYDLALLGKMLPDNMTSQQYLDSIANGPLFTDSSIEYWGYRYDNGTFQFDSDYNGIGFQFRACRKGVFDTVFLNIGDLDDYEQWEYQNVFGTQLILAQSGYKSLVLLDIDDFFIVVNVLEGTSGSTWNSTPKALSRSDFEAFADLIDFGQIRTDHLPALVKPVRPDLDLTSPEAWQGAQTMIDLFDEAVAPFVSKWERVETIVNNSTGIAIFENEILVILDNGFTLFWTGDGIEKYFESNHTEIAPGSKGIIHRLFINDVGELDMHLTSMFRYNLSYEGLIHPDTLWYDNPLTIEYDSINKQVIFTDWLGDIYIYAKSE